MAVIDEATAEERRAAPRDKAALQEGLERLSADMVRATASGIDQSVVRSLGLLAPILGATRAWLSQAADTGRRIEITHQWHAPGASPSPSFLEQLLEQQPCVVRMLSGRPHLSIGSPHDLPGDARDAHGCLQRHGFRPLLALPLSIGSSFFGALCFLGREDEELTWDPEALPLLRIAGSILVGGLRRKAAEEAGAQSEVRYRVLFDSASDAMFVTDTASGQLLDANRPGQALLGRSLGELRGLHHTLLYPPDERALAATLLSRKSIEPGRSFSELHVLAAGDRRVPVEIGLSEPIALGTTTALIGTFRDVTERQQLEQRLHLRLMVQEALARIASDLIRLPSTDLDVAINDALSTLGTLAGAARAAVWSASPDGRSASATHEWFASTTDPRPPRQVSMSSFGRYQEILERDRSLVISRPSEIPPDATEERAYAEAHGFEALLFVPLFYTGDKLQGALGFYGPVGVEHPWDPDLISLLDVAGGIIVNALARRQAEAALRENERRLSRILECSPVGMAILDRQGEITLVNSAAEKILGLDRAQLHEQPYQELVRRLSHVEQTTPTDRLERQVPAVVQGDLLQSAERQLELPNGQQVTLAVSLTSLRDERGEVQGQVTVFSDITERKKEEAEHRRLEAQVQHAQKLESLGVLAGGIAHDFNNLLAAILGNIDLVMGDLPKASRAKDALHDAELAARRAAELTKQMLAYSGKGRMAVVPIDVGAMIEEMLQMLRVSASKKAELRVRLASNLPKVEGDAAQLHQVVMNLVMNASEAIGDTPGLITLSTGVKHCEVAELRAGRIDRELPAGQYVFIEVADTGCGMDAETRSRIFDPFFSTKFIGRGLGLAAVHGIVRGHKGAIQIQSEPGEGSTFRVLLPVSARAARAAQSNAEAPRAAEWRGEGTVLLIDDEGPVRAVTRRMLERLGFSVIEARNGKEGVELFRTHAESIRLVLLDLAMPQMGGEEAYPELHGIAHNVPVLVASGYSEQEVARRFGSAGVAGFVQKPFQLATLQAKLRAALQRRS